LGFDRYGYRYAHGRWGSDDARLVLGGREHGLVPRRVLERRLRVRRRIGVDRDPVDVTTGEGARWPGGVRRRLANVHYHGAWLEWIGG
jgi:hypothetical protein